MIYKDKETGEIVTMSEIKKSYDELLGNSEEFEEYRDNFENFLNDYYLEIEED